MSDKPGPGSLEAKMPRMPDLSFLSHAWFAVLACVFVLTPFLVVRIPPLTDVPGHMGAAAVAAYANDPAFARLMGFHWILVPNLGTDLVVAAMRRVVGITGAYWLVCAIIPPLFVTGIFMVARILNPRGAAAIGWALIFIYSYPFNYGFLNYMLGVALSLIGFAVWMLLDARPRLRAAIACIAVPLVFLCHAVAGCLVVLFICSREFELLRQTGRIRSFLVKVWPLLSSLAIILVWRLGANSFAGQNEMNVKAKLNGLIMLLRDQNLLLDEGSLVVALVIFMMGWWKGARPHRAVMPALFFLIPLFVVTPSVLSGSSYADERLLVLIPVLAFTTQDWSRVDARLARFVAISGLVLFVARLGVTFAGFVAYDRRFTTELGALEHIAEHSRVLVLNTRYCSARHNWRASRLGHLGDLAIVYRRSWTNSEWDTDGAHLVQVRYRPSMLFYDDPSQYVWPASCGGIEKGHPTVLDAVATLPLGGIDFLWLIDSALPRGYHNPRLAKRWQSGSSALYAVLRPTDQRRHDRPDP